MKQTHPSAWVYAKGVANQYGIPEHANRRGNCKNKRNKAGSTVLL